MGWAPAGTPEPALRGPSSWDAGQTAPLGAPRGGSPSTGSAPRPPRARRTGGSSCLEPGLVEGPGDHHAPTPVPTHTPSQTLEMRGGRQERHTSQEATSWWKSTSTTFRCTKRLPARRGLTPTCRSCTPWGGSAKTPLGSIFRNRVASGDEGFRHPPPRDPLLGDNLLGAHAAGVRQKGQISVRAGPPRSQPVHHRSDALCWAGPLPHGGDPSGSHGAAGRSPPGR